MSPPKDPSFHLPPQKEIETKDFGMILLPYVTLLLKNTKLPPLPEKKKWNFYTLSPKELKPDMLKWEKELKLEDNKTNSLMMLKMITKKILSKNLYDSFD